MSKKIKCPKCNSENTKKDGKRKTENRGEIQRFKCKACNYRFIEKDGFYRMRNSPQKVTLCLDLFFRGISTRKIQEHLQAFYPHNSDNSTIYRWVVKYAKQIHSFTDTLKLRTGYEVQVDEIEFHRRKSHKQSLGIDRNWFIDSIDTKTRFMVASGYEKTRGHDEIKSVIRSIKEKTGEQLEVITTDGLLTYERAIKQGFGYNLKYCGYNIVHNSIKASKGEGFNYPIERLHNTIRHRTKTFRGFHGSIESAKAIMKGLEIYYNFITRHQAIDCCPYELATNLKLSSNNKWLELIELSV